MQARARHLLFDCFLKAKGAKSIAAMFGQVDKGEVLPSAPESGKVAEKIANWAIRVWGETDRGRCCE
jgi:hypothetical protein